MSPVNISISRANNRHLQTVRDLSISTFCEAFAAVNTEENMQAYLEGTFSEAALHAELERPENLFFIATVEDEPAGYSKFKQGPVPSGLPYRQVVELERIYVLKKYHRQKIGAALLQHALDTARQMQAEALWLGVWEHNETALRFYRQWGFVPFGSHIFQLGDDAQTDLLMYLPL